MDYKENIQISSSFVDKNKVLKLPALITLFQNFSCNAIIEAGFPKEKTFDKGKLWIITRTYVEINKMPSLDDVICFQTYPNPILKFIYPRQTLGFFNNGDLSFRICSLWALLDKNNRKLLFPEQTGVFLPGENKEGELKPPSKVARRECSLIYQRKVTYSDIDLNSHLNNAKYFEYVLDAHDSSFYDIHKIKSITAEYLKEVKEGTVVSIYSDLKNPEYFEIRNDNDVMFICEIRYND